MAQLGLHGMVGLYGGRVIAPAVAAEPNPSPETTADPLKPKKDFAFGFVLGNILPDTDFFLLVFAFLIAPKGALTLHRTFSHSLVTIAVLTAVLWLARGRAGRPLAWGVGFGMISHAVLDMIIWFSGVNFLWPLGYLGVPSVINFWTQLQPARVVSNLLGAADYPAFALYFLVLRAAAKRTGTVPHLLPRLNLFTNLCWILMVVFGALSFVFTGGMTFDIAHYAVFTLVLLPIVLWVTVKFRPAIEASVGAPRPQVAAPGTPTGTSAGAPPRG